MSAVAVAQSAPEATGEAVLSRRYVNVTEAGLIAGRHPETVRQAARDGSLHGSQREGVNPRTGKPYRGAQWRFRPECIEAWVDGVPCPHQVELRRPVSLAEYRTRR